MAAPTKAGPKPIGPPVTGTCSDTLFRITRLSDGTVRIERKSRVQQSPGRDGRTNTMHLSWPDLIEKEELHRWLIATVEASPATWE